MWAPITLNYVSVKIFNSEYSIPLLQIAEECALNSVLMVNILLCWGTQIITKTNLEKISDFGMSLSEPYTNRSPVWLTT